MNLEFSILNFELELRIKNLGLNSILNIPILNTKFQILNSYG
jgi:hypothetical protein